jgi:hypothetical protein
MDETDLLAGLRGNPDVTIEGDTKLDPTAAVVPLADALVTHLRESLLAGVQPDGRTPMPKNADGEPRGVASGRLANGWHREDHGKEARVTPSADRIEAAIHIYAGIDIMPVAAFEAPRVQEGLTKAALAVLGKGAK